MGLLLGLIVNALLLSIPIGSTLGTLFKLRPFRNDIIQQPKDHNHIIVISACEEFHEFAQNKIGVNYTVNSNEILPETDSTLCMTMTTFENNTYPSNSTAPPFSFTWEYPFTTANKSSPVNETKPLIHAFPQARIDSSVIPLALEELGQLTLDFTWTMGTGDTIAPSTGLLPLGAKEVNASVGLDMYMDPDQTMAGDAGNATFEMIIFFAHFGLQDPVGFGNGTVVMTNTLGGTDFNLFVGRNANSQNVFSWVATQPVGEFHSDITPLFNSILSLRGTKGLTVDIPTYTDFLGYVGFGTQAYSSIGNVTFWVPRLSIDMQKLGT